MVRRFLFVLLALPLLALAACSANPPGLDRGNFQEASLVVGQDDFSGLSAGLDASHINGPRGAAVIHDGSLYLPDYGNNRILVFDEVPTTGGAAADFALGQPDLVSNNAGSGASQLTRPQGALVSGDKFIVNDYGNNRILIWNTVPTAPGEAADVVVGQTDFGESGAACARNGLLYPEGVFVLDGRLFVADSGNNRVLIWNEIPTTNGEDADLVLGQDLFTTCEENEGGSTSAGGMAYPADMWSDGTRLLVADMVNSRILFWTSFPTENGEPADIVLGQDDMTSSEQGVAADRFEWTYFVASDGTQIYATDHDNNRILVWNSFPTSNGEAANRVLGQSDFNHSMQNDLDQDGVADGVASAKGLYEPMGLALFGEKLIVADSWNNRYLFFETQ